MVIDLQLIGFYHELIVFQKKKKKRILGYFNLFIFEVLIFVTIKPSFESYQYLMGIKPVSYTNIRHNKKKAKHTGRRLLQKKKIRKKKKTT
ncbi:hypothetical protein [Helicobacter pylori]|uniref:hypothetical protein n=1 Tax=Helicobacter pylori TaxID=210 RepID=UPI0036F2B506